MNTPAAKQQPLPPTVAFCPPHLVSIQKLAEPPEATSSGHGGDGRLEIDGRQHWDRNSICSNGSALQITVAHNFSAFRVSYFNY